MLLSHRIFNDKARSYVSLQYGQPITLGIINFISLAWHITKHVGLYGTFQYNLNVDEKQYLGWGYIVYIWYMVDEEAISCDGSEGVIVHNFHQADSKQQYMKVTSYIAILRLYWGNLYTINLHIMKHV